MISSSLYFPTAGTEKVFILEHTLLLGFDDFRSAAALTPPLSVVEQNPVGMGAKAVEELARVIETGQSSRAISQIPARLVLRASSGRRTNLEQGGHRSIGMHVGHGRMTRKLSRRSGLRLGARPPPSNHERERPVTRIEPRCQRGRESDEAGKERNATPYSEPGD